MIPPACNLALTFTTDGGWGGWWSVRVKPRTPNVNWPMETLRGNSRGTGEVERETGEGQEVSGRNKEVREGQRKEGTNEGTIRGSTLGEERSR